MVLASYLILFFFCCCSAVQADHFVGSVVSRIQNGFDAEQREIPYAVALQNSENSHHFCGGSILSDTWVLTAAHCTRGKDYDLQADQIQVATGTIRSAPVSVHRVTKIHRHEKYDKNDSVINDIALLKITPPFVFNDSVAPVKLPVPDLYISPGTKAVVAGWGRKTHQNSTKPELLQKLDVTIVAENYCKEKYMMLLYNIYTVHLCTHETTGISRGSCKGDSGGPLTIGNTIVGIVSWSRTIDSCSNFPSVHTRVSQFIDWISENMHK